MDSKVHCSLLRLQSTTWSYDAWCFTQCDIFKRVSGGGGGGLEAVACRGGGGQGRPWPPGASLATPPDHYRLLVGDHYTWLISLNDIWSVKAKTIGADQGGGGTSRVSMFQQCNIFFCLSVLPSSPPFPAVTQEKILLQYYLLKKVQKHVPCSICLSWLIRDNWILFGVYIYAWFWHQCQTNYPSSEHVWSGGLVWFIGV